MWADIHRGWGYVGNNPVNLIDPFGLRAPNNDPTNVPEALNDAAEQIAGFCSDLWDHAEFAAYLALLGPAFVTWPVREGADIVAEDLGLRDEIGECSFGFGQVASGDPRWDAFNYGVSIALKIAGVVIDWRKNIPSAQELEDTIEYHKKRIYGDQ